MKYAFFAFFIFVTAQAEPKGVFESLHQTDDVVWGFDFLSDGRIIFTERGGALKIFDPKTKMATAIAGAPKVWSRGQGGLLDVRVHPTVKNRIYLTYSEPVDGGSKATTAAGFGTLDGNELKNFKRFLSASEPNSNDIHFGSRLEFDGQGHVFVTVGDRNARKNVQDLSYHTGKILRFNDDGSVPSDNPFVKRANAKPEIWTIGHRSPQGLVRDAKTGALWEGEMGPKGGDEINLIKAGANYGWPEVTYGTEYYGAKIGVKSKAGTVQPVVYWVPSISFSGITIYTGDAYKEWQGDLFLATLATTHLHRVDLKNGKVVAQEELLKDVGSRWRNVRTGPDGFLYLSSDDGKLGRLIKTK